MEMVERTSELQQKNTTEAGSEYYTRFVTRAEDLADIGMEWGKEVGRDLNPVDVKEEASRFISSSYVIGVYLGEKLVGFIAVQVENPLWLGEKILVENMMYIRKDHRGRGLGKILIDRVSVAAEMLKCSHVFAFPNAWGSDNPEKAKEIFEKKGYNFHGYVVRKDVYGTV